MSLASNPETQGVYIVRIHDVYDRKHAVCLDLRSSPGIIYDSAEAYALTLCEESFRMCCGEADPAKYKGFDDLRLVRVIQESRTKRNRRSRRDIKVEATFDDAGHSASIMIYSWFLRLQEVIALQSC